MLSYFIVFTLLCIFLICTLCDNLCDESPWLQIKANLLILLMISNKMKIVDVCTCDISFHYNAKCWLSCVAAIAWCVSRKVFSLLLLL